MILSSANKTVFGQASVTSQATAEVIQALTASEGATLNFGKFSPENEGGEIVITPDGNRVSIGKLVLGGGSYNPAFFYLTGQPEFSVNIKLPTTPILLTNTEKGKTMEIRNWASIPPVGGGVKIQNDGRLSLSVGATLKVGNMNENPVGKYIGTYSIIFGYD